MRNRFYSFLSAAAVISALLVSCGPSAKINKGGAPLEEVVVLYENDVHCGVDGYASFAALKYEMKLAHKHVTLVSSGDFVQGGSLGAASHGRNIIDIMNVVDYDFVTLGNHEFDYSIPRQQELMADLNATCLCCNFKSLETGGFLYKPYEIVNYGDFDVAFVGMSTPYTITSSTPTYFKNADGEFIYSFCIEDFYKVVQDAVDAARAEGAEYVIVISHLGDEDEGEGGINSLSMVARTSGIDVVLDGHSHSVIPAMTLKNSKGEEVLLSSTGTKFEYMGKLTFNREGGFKTELIKTADYPIKDNEVLKAVEAVREGYRKVADQVVCTADAPLRIYNDAGERLVRSEETGIGNFCTDAYRMVFDTDIALLNGGGIRADLPGGNITFNDIFTMFPFEKVAATCDITGATLLDLLEMSVSIAPGEFGGFHQVSGLKFEYDSKIPSPVVYDSDHNFAGVSGERRVRNVMVLDKESGKYLPLDPAKTYKMAASNYLVVDHGDGFTMTKDCTNVNDTGTLDTDLIGTFLEKYLDKHIPESYSRPEGRIVRL